MKILAESLEKEHKIRCVKYDVRDFIKCKETMPEIIEKLGGEIDILINNAGITSDRMLHKQEYENWEKVIKII